MLTQGQLWTGNCARVTESAAKVDFRFDPITIVGVALAAAPAIVGIPSPSFGQTVQALRPVAAQTTELSCGVAALANLLTWAGYRTTEAELDDKMRRSVLAENDAAISEYLTKGASSPELIKLVDALDIGFQLKPEIVSIDQAMALARRESFIVFLVESGGTTGTRTHFTIVAGFDSTRGWLRADSIDGKHVWQKDDEFSRSALVQREGTRILVLRLLHGKSIAVGPEPSAATASSNIPWIAAGRMLSNLNRTDAIYARIDFGYSADSFTDSSTRIRSSAVSATASLSYPITQRLAATIAVPVSSGQAQLDLPGFYRFDLGSQTGFGPVSFGMTRRFDRRKHGTGQFSAGGTIRIDSKDGIVGLGFRGGFDRQLGKRSVVSAQVDLDRDKGLEGWSIGIAPSIGIVRFLDDRTSVNGDLLALVPLQSDSRPTVIGSVGVSRQFGNSWAIGINTSWTLVSDPGYRSRSVGLSITRRFGLRSRPR